MWDDINHPFLNFNSGTIEVWEWISNFIPHFMLDFSNGRIIKNPQITGLWDRNPSVTGRFPGQRESNVGKLCHQHDDVIKWKHFPRYWPFVRGIHWSPVNSTHKGQWCGVLMFSMICVWINSWVNNREVGDLRCHRTWCFLWSSSE